MTTSTATVDVTLLAGGRVRVTATFTPLGDTVPADPSSVVFKTLEPGASAATTYTYGSSAEITRVSAGVFTFTRTYPTAGDWWVKVIGSGGSGINAVAEIVVRAKATVIA